MSTEQTPNPTEPTAPPAPVLNLDQVLFYESGNVSRRLGDMSTAGLAYVAQYGFAQSLQDSIAGLDKRVRADLSDPADDMPAADKAKAIAAAAATRVKLTTECKIPADSDIDTIAKAVIAKRLEDRADAIVRGELTIGTGRGPRRTGRVGFIWESAVNFAVTHAKATNTGLPKKAEAYNALIQGFIDSPKWGPRIVAAAEKAMAEADALAKEFADEIAGQMSGEAGPAQDESAPTETPATNPDLPVAPARTAKGKGKAA